MPLRKPRSPSIPEVVKTELRKRAPKVSAVLTPSGVKAKGTLTSAGVVPVTRPSKASIPRVVGGSDSRPGTIRVDPSIRVMSQELRRAMLEGRATTLPVPRGTTRKDARLMRQRELSDSPLVLQALKDRLLGKRIGSPIRTDDDLRRLGHLFGLSEARTLDRRGIASRIEQAKRRVTEELQGKLGFLRRGILGLKKAGLTVAGKAVSVAEKIRDAVGRLTGRDELGRLLKGFNLQKKAPTKPISRPGFSPVSKGGTTMIGVSSSNVAAVGWWAENPDEPLTRDTVGTMQIDYNQGWSYIYYPCAHWIYEGLLRAGSKGQYVWAVLRRGIFADGVPWGDLSVNGYTRIR